MKSHLEQAIDSFPSREYTFLFDFMCYISMEASENVTWERGNSDSN